MKMASLYDTVTNNIVAELEKGVAPWVQPWTTNRRTKLGWLPGNAAARRNYRHQHPDLVAHGDPGWLRRSRLDDVQGAWRERAQGRARNAKIIFRRSAHPVPPFSV